MIMSWDLPVIGTVWQAALIRSGRKSIKKACLIRMTLTSILQL